MLAYYDGFIIIGLGSIPALIGCCNAVWRAISALSGIWCALYRMRKCREKRKIPIDNYDRYYDEFDYFVTD